MTSISSAHNGTSNHEESWLERTMAQDPVVARLLPDVRQLAASEAPALIAGEPGCGRELAARAVHNLSSRASQPFVVIDCATLSEPLIEAELLGIEGVSRSARPHKVGIFEQAGAGTVLLSEVGELPPRAQESLVHFLDRHEVVRLNADEAIPAKARCLASTSIDLRARAAAGLFREDLWARLTGEQILLTPLREHPEDVPSLARHFLEQCCTQLGPAACELAPNVEAVLRAYPWPGNVRELRETIEEAALRAHGERIDVDDLPERVRSTSPSGSLPSLRDVEMRHIERVLAEAHGNQRRASRILGISRWSLSRRLRKYGMQPRAED
jgi:DNA-binding NtrC family response regulator